MMRKRNIQLVLLIFTLAFICQSMQPLMASPAPAGKKEATQSFLFKKNKLPHEELERVQPTAAAGAQLQVHKTVTPSLSLPVSSSFGNLFVLHTLQIRRSSLLIKDYLFHIYPYHHFW